jgi:hypothetical protein
MITVLAVGEYGPRAAGDKGPERGDMGGLVQAVEVAHEDAARDRNVPRIALPLLRLSLRSVYNP